MYLLRYFIHFIINYILIIFQVLRLLMKSHILLLINQSLQMVKHGHFTYIN